MNTDEQFHREKVEEPIKKTVESTLDNQETQKGTPEYRIGKLIQTGLEKHEDPDIITTKVATADVEIIHVGATIKPDGSLDLRHSLRLLPDEDNTQKAAEIPSHQTSHEQDFLLPDTIIQDYRAAGIKVENGQPNFESNQELRRIFDITARLFESNLSLEEAQKQTNSLWDNLARKDPKLVETLAKYSDFSALTYAGNAVDAYNRLLNRQKNQKIAGVTTRPDGTRDYRQALRWIGKEYGDKNVAQAEDQDINQSLQGITALKNTLAVRYPTLTEPQRLSQWIREQKLTFIPLDLGGEIPGMYKDVYITEDNPNIIVKRFRDRSGLETEEEEIFDAERSEFGLLHTYIGDEFLPATEFVELSDAKGEKQEFYVLQDKLTGIRYKSVLNESLYLERGNENTFMDFVSEVLSKKFTAETWEKLQAEAGRLVEKLGNLESGNLRLRDFDFFITDSGEIKIIDYEVFDKTTTDKPLPDDEIKGLEDIKTLFKLGS